jgi:uncharacterized protein
MSIAGILCFSKSTSRFLLIQRSHEVDTARGKWSFPAGFVRRGEDPQTASFREFVNQTDFDGEMEVDLLAEVYDEEYSETFHAFLGFVEAEFTPVLDFKAQQFKWVTLKELLSTKNLHPGVAALLKDNDVRSTLSSISHRTDEVKPSSSHLPVISAVRLRSFEPRKEWFLVKKPSIHGIDHETRVLIWTQVLATMEGGVDADVLGCAAALHDVRRTDDGEEPSHGAASAKWLRAHPEVLYSHIPLERVEYLCRWHVPSDRRAPVMTRELAVFKDADALDRWRFEEPDPRYFRTESARKLFSVSRDLADLSIPVPRGVSPFEYVLSAAIKLGIVI